MMSRRSGRPSPPVWVWLAALVLLGVSASVGRDWLPPSDPSERGVAVSVEDGEDQVRALFESHRSGDVVVIAGVVDRVLSDDETGSRHQRFVVRMASGRTLLVAHNIDLARRVPLQSGDPVRLRGEYEWNAQGGVVHWTHHDPSGDRQGGWIDFAGERYR